MERPDLRSRNGASLDPTSGDPQVLEEGVLLRCGPNNEIESGGFSERTEIPISRKKRDPAIDTALSDGCIPKARLSALGQHFRSQLACPLPLAVLDLDERQFRKNL